MTTLKRATAPLDRDAKAARHETEVRRIEALLALPDLDPDARQRLQASLLREARTLNELRNPHQVRGDRMRAYVGLNPYYFNG